MRSQVLPRPTVEENMTIRRSLLPFALFLALATPAHAQDYFTSPNVEYVRSIKTDVGLTAGSTVVGDRLFVTSAKNIAIYDISTPEDPQQIGLLNANIAWENEEVPTNGEILGTSNDFFDLAPSCLQTLAASITCLQIYDVRDPENIKEIGALPDNGDHTSTCILDCQYMYGSEGSITDLRGVLDGAEPQDLGSWMPAVAAQMGAEDVNDDLGCHHVREMSPGIILTACQPFHVLSVREEDGGSITEPKVLASGGHEDGRFIHSAVWPRGGKDKFALLGGETNFNPDCSRPVLEDKVAAFEVWDNSDTMKTGQFGEQTDEVRPVNGQYADGKSPVNHLGCSVHWFQEHPTFKNGGLVALAEYEHGLRFLQITREGKIVEQGYWQPLGGSTSSPDWAPDGRTIYATDYERGLDVLRWNGDLYEGGKAQKPPRGSKGSKSATAIRGTRGRQPVLPALTDAQRAAGAKRIAALKQQGWVRGLCQLASTGKLAERRAAR